MLNNFRIDVTDLTRFSRELQSIGSEEFKRGLRPVLLKFARGVVPKISARYARHYPRTRRHAVVRAEAGIDRATIVLRTVQFRYLMGQEFGSERYRQFRPWTGTGPRGMGSHGRFLYPTLRAEVPGMTEELMDAVMDVAGRAFPDRVLR